MGHQNIYAEVVWGPSEKVTSSKTGRSLRIKQTSGHFDLSPPASRTMRKERFVFSCLVCSMLSWKPQQTNTVSQSLGHCLALVGQIIWGSDSPLNSCRGCTSICIASELLEDVYSSARCLRLSTGYLGIHFWGADSRGFSGVKWTFEDMGRSVRCIQYFLNCEPWQTWLRPEIQASGSLSWLLLGKKPGAGPPQTLEGR